MGDQPLFRFGLVTDVQHADKDTVVFDDRPQRYRESAGKLQLALTDLHRIHSTQQPLAFLLTLGDVIDGYNAGYPAADSQAAALTSRDLQEVAGMFISTLQQLPVRHVLGNHCLAAPRGELLKALQMPNSYYSVQLEAGWKLVVLDTTDMCPNSGYAESSLQMKEARQWLAAHPKEQHPNAEPWNGGLTTQQLTWLHQQLAEAAAAGQQVIVACHHPLAPGSAPDQYLAWNFEAILSLLEEHVGVVRLVLSGHYHPGGYSERKGVHYVVFEGILEVPENSNAYAVVDVYPGKICIQGYGQGSSRELVLP